MCGIIAFFGNESTQNTIEQRELFLKLSKLIRHRGPDWNGIFEDHDAKVFIGHERLSIVSPESGSQPIISEDNNQVLSVNGEIYNYKELYRHTLLDKYNCSSKSDCEVIMHLLENLEEIPQKC